MEKEPDLNPGPDAPSQDVPEDAPVAVNAEEDSRPGPEAAVEEGASEGEADNGDAVPAETSEGKPEAVQAFQEMIPVVLIGVRLRPRRPAVHYDAGEMTTADGEWVVVTTEHGPEVGQVAGAPLHVELPDTTPPAPIVRLASTEEIERYYINVEREKEAWQFCEERIRAHGLSMKLVRVERFFDGSRIIFYYAAENRVDFRELVKDLVKGLQTRIEMRQIGIRHEAKMVGGIGSCGREICCASFLKDFGPISIKMAKAQNLPLNPNKISGLCGRLLCCLTYEYNTYLQLRSEMPGLGKPCKTPAGEGKVVRQNVLRQTVTVALADGGEVEFEAAELLAQRRGGAQKPEREGARPASAEKPEPARPEGDQAQGPPEETEAESPKSGGRRRPRRRKKPRPEPSAPEAPPARKERQEPPAGPEAEGASPRRKRRPRRGRGRQKTEGGGDKKTPQD